MKFEDLINLSCYAGSEKIDIEKLALLLPDTPKEILEQFYSDHGKNPDFQTQYQNINIDKLSWAKEKLSAQKIVACDVFPDFLKFFNNVSQRISNFNEKKWECIDPRKNVIDYWRQNKTWVSPPIFLQGKVVGLGSKLKLVEGHTRVGLLKGLVGHGIVASYSKHQIWLGM